VIRADAVNFYTFAADLRPGSPTTCPGDSGGPVLKDGQVVGVHGSVYGLSARDAARSNMSVNLHPLAGWDAWSQAGAATGTARRGDRTPTGH
jgi:Trypsin